MKRCMQCTEGERWGRGDVGEDGGEDGRGGGAPKGV